MTQDEFWSLVTSRGDLGAAGTVYPGVVQEGWYTRGGTGRAIPVPTLQTGYEVIPAQPTHSSHTVASGARFAGWAPRSKGGL